MSTRTFDNNNNIHNVLKLLEKINQFNKIGTSSNKTQSQKWTDELPEYSHTSVNKNKRVVEDDVPGSTQTKTVKVDKGPSNTKSIVDDEVEGNKEHSSSRKNIPKKLSHLKINMK